MHLHKKEIAVRQIEEAVHLFLSGRDFISVITLAGAGEEILGCLLERKGLPRMIDHLVEIDFKINGHQRPFKELNGEVNGIRNALKHAKQPEEDEIEIDPEHAVAMIARALANYSSLEFSLTPAMQKFYDHIKSTRPDLTSETNL